jgi:hypothetical protein
MLPQYSLYLAGNGNQTVSSAATAMQLSTTDTACRWVYVTAWHANTGIVAVGISTVIATAGSALGVCLDKGVSCLLPAKNLNEVWIDATVNNEGVSYAYYLNSIP